MRDIKFRGKSDNDWVYGFLMKVDDIDQAEHDKFDYFIQTDKVEDEEYKKFYITDNNTIGQYTGLHDKNGTEIYEGDIVTNGDKNIRYVVEWIDTGLKARQTGNKSYIGLNAWKGTLEVIGNIYDNPELLGE